MLNKDYKTRNQIIFGDEDTDNWPGGCRDFKTLTLIQLENLVNKNFVELEDCQNLSPSIKDFLEFMKKYPKVTAHGYAVSHNREDYSVGLEGLAYRGKTTKKMLKDFIYLCRLADEFVAEDNELYAWWD